MGRLPRGNRKYQIQELWEVHHEINRRLIMGQKAVEIAAALNITPAVVSYTRNSAIGLQELRIMRGARDKSAIDVTKRIRSITPDAIDVLEELMNDGEDTPKSLRVRIAQDILSRGGHPTVSKVTGGFMHGVFTSEDVEKLKERALKRGSASGLITSKNGNGEMKPSTEELPANMEVTEDG